MKLFFWHAAVVFLLPILLSDSWKIFYVFLLWSTVVCCWCLGDLEVLVDLIQRWMTVLYTQFTMTISVDFKLDGVEFRARSNSSTKTWEDSVGTFPPVESNRVTLIWLPSFRRAELYLGWTSSAVGPHYSCTGSKLWWRCMTPANLSWPPSPPESILCSALSSIVLLDLCCMLLFHHVSGVVSASY